LTVIRRVRPSITPATVGVKGAGWTIRRRYAVRDLHPDRTFAAVDERVSTPPERLLMLG
jgi:hypothetical protein